MLEDIVMSATPKPTVRRATRDDLTAIVRIERASFGRDAWERSCFADYLSALENCLFLVASMREIVVGYALAVHNQSRCELDSIAVAPSYRGLGVAAALMSRLNLILRRRGVSAMMPTVRLDNAAAIGLYRKLGFRRERRINGYYDDLAPAWRMRTFLGPPRNRRVIRPERGVPL
jgi:ribosomal-protein-alanine N-acetyltransferase